MATKNPPQSKQSPAQSGHPETKKPKPNVAAPGAESSKTKHRAADQRNAADKDGNEQQAGKKHV